MFNNCAYSNCLIDDRLGGDYRQAVSGGRLCHARSPGSVFTVAGRRNEHVRRTMLRCRVSRAVSRAGAWR
jgi:hypothetical protein